MGLSRKRHWQHADKEDEPQHADSPNTSTSTSSKHKGRRASYYHSLVPAAPPAFQFSSLHSKMDWRALHGVDIDRLVRPIQTLQDMMPVLQEDLAHYGQ